MRFNEPGHRGRFFDSMKTRAPKHRKRAGVSLRMRPAMPYVSVITLCGALIAGVLIFSNHMPFDMRNNAYGKNGCRDVTWSAPSQAKTQVTVFVMCGFTDTPQSHRATPTAGPYPPTHGWQWVIGPAGGLPIMVQSLDVNKWWNLYRTDEDDNCYRIALEERPLMRT